MATHPFSVTARRLVRAGSFATVTLGVLMAASALATGAAHAAPGASSTTAAAKEAARAHVIGAEVGPDGTRGPHIRATVGRAPATGAGGFRNLCSGHAVEYGNWVNADPNARGIARIELRDCQPVTRCSGSTCTVVHDAGWSMRAFGRCWPTNCDWGWSAGQFRLSSGHIYGYYNQGFAKRYVYASMSRYRPGQLWVYWRTDFSDPNRADYEMHEWFVRG